MTSVHTISSSEIEKHLSADFRGLSLVVVDETESTNDMAKTLVNKGEIGFAVIANRQSAGKGRGDHKWVSPEGGIYLSMPVEINLPKRHIPLLNLTMAVAVAEAILQTTGESVSLKWPNDLYLDGKKLGGVLIEAATGSIDYIVAGIGVNLNSDIELFSAELKKSILSLYSKTGLTYDPNIFCAALITAIDKWVDITVTNPKMVIKEWSRISLTLGSLVTFVSGGRIISGLATGIDEEGFLMVKDSNSGVVDKIVSPNLVGERCS